MQCEICGKTTVLYRTIIEETEMKACKDCARFGKVLGELKKPISEDKKKAAVSSAPSIIIAQKNEPIEKIVDDYSAIIKRKREQMGMTQKEFAMFLNEKESMLHKIEIGGLEPNIKTAQKFEKILNVKLIEEYEEKKQDSGQRSSSGAVTIGDIIALKRRN